MSAGTRRPAAALGDHADAGRRSRSRDRARALLADDRALARPRGRASWNAPPSTPSIRWCRKAGARAACCWQAMPATRRRRSWARACAPACAMPPTSPGSLPPCTKGSASDTLLDTYESERLPHVRTFIDLAVTSRRACCRKPIPRPRRARDARFEAGAEMFDYPAAAARPRLPRRATPPPVGTIFPQPRLADGRLMDEAIGQRFAVVGRSRASREPADRCRAAAGRRPGLAGPAQRAAVLRPDRYVFALSQTIASSLSTRSRHAGQAGVNIGSGGPPSVGLKTSFTGCSHFSLSKSQSTMLVTMRGPSARVT